MAATALIALLAAACGDSTADEPTAASSATTATVLATATDAYVAQVRLAIAAMQAFARQREALDAHGLRDAAPRLAEAAASLDAAIDDLAPLTPPAAYRDAHESIVGALRGLHANMDDVVRAARAGDETAFAAADARFRQAAQRLARAAARIGA